MQIKKEQKTKLLLILDGFGHSLEQKHNAIAIAKTSNWDKIWNSYPNALLSCSGLDVGLPEGQMGNSEVGHMTIGAGRVIYQDLTKINLAIKDQTFFQNKTLIESIKTSPEHSSLHILGLLSPGGVHSHEEHIHALIKLASQYKNKNIYIHAFLDGRDTPPKSAQDSLIKLEELCNNTPCEIASITGRFYAMDRDKKYERTKLAYELLTTGKTNYTFNNALKALEQAYKRGETDEFVKPTKIQTKNNNALIKNNDSVIFMNFRSDRAQQICQELLNLNLRTLVTLTDYSLNSEKIKIAFPKKMIDNTLGKYLSKHNLTQLRIAETEKYAHVTFFFDGGQDVIFSGATRELIQSPKIATYDLKPEMSLKEVNEKLISAILSNKYNVIICNFANADMVGHSGNFEATIKAIEAIDLCLGEVTNAILSVNGEMIITADHGNAEIMCDQNTMQPHTAHTNSPVPFVYVGNKKTSLKKENGKLSDIAPSLLTLLELPIPKEMTGKSLI